MSTSLTTVQFILTRLGHGARLQARPMFGEYGLYADDKFVGVICDGQLYVKILPASAPLAADCEQDAPYPGAKPHYLVDETQLLTRTDVADILFAMAAALPAKKPKPAKRQG